MSKRQDIRRFKRLSLKVLGVFFVLTLLTGNTWGETPSVISVTSGNGEIRVSFSTEMDPSTLNNDTFIVTLNTGYGHGIVAGKINYGDAAAIFTANSSLFPGPSYTVRITTGAKDAAGNPLAADFVRLINKTSGGMERVSFLSEGDKIIGNLHIPENYEEGTKLPAIVICQFASGLKEQSAGIYAKKLAEKGLIALAFDHRHWGESEGEPRYYEDPIRRAEDIGNAVSFLRTLDKVDADKIGGLGICVGAGYMLHAAVFDRRIKAVGTVSGLFDPQSDVVESGGRQAFIEMMEAIGLAKQKYYETGEQEHFPVIPPGMEEVNDFWRGAYDYFTGRGHVPNWVGHYDFTSFAKIGAFSAVPDIKLLAPTPFLLIVGTESPRLEHAEKVYETAGDPKELFWIEGAIHQELFDLDEYVNPAVEKLSSFYKDALK